ncbi:MAG: hypothetical protein HFJ80_04280 [Clostridiales bacterium]|nr:hypothetical protein [Clostridiales bacterium]
MKFVRKTACLLLSTALLFSAAAISTAAQENSGVGIVPIVEPNFWQSETGGDNAYVELNGEDAYTITEVKENGAIQIRRSAKAKNRWVRIATMHVELMPTLDLEKNPYLYFDLTCDTEWNINFTINGQPFGLAKLIATANMSAQQPIAPAYDGKAGTYQGKVNLKEFIEKEVPALAGINPVMAPHIGLYIVDTTPDGVSGTLTINKLAIGNDDPNDPEGVRLDMSMITGYEPDPNVTLITSPLKTPTTKKDSPSGDGSQNNADNLAAILVVVAIVVVAAAIVVAVIIIRKRSGGDSSGSKK